MPPTFYTEGGHIMHIMWDKKQDEIKKTTKGEKRMEKSKKEGIFFVKGHFYSNLNIFCNKWFGNLYYYVKTYLILSCQ